MSAPMVCATLREVDAKWQTRRVAKFAPFDKDNPLVFSGLKAGLYGRGVPSSGWVLRSIGHGGCWNDRTKPLHCPYGQPGDRLWVRERHCFLDVTKSALSQFPLGPQNNNARGPDIWNLCIEYSDGTQHETNREGKKPKQTRERGETKWRPGMFMPRWASRITLEITGVRVERVQEISGDDVLAEGIRSAPLPSRSEMDMALRATYRELWDSLNAKRGFGWDKNPWVWVIEFKPC